MVETPRVRKDQVAFQPKESEHLKHDAANIDHKNIWFIDENGKRKPYSSWTPTLERYPDYKKKLHAEKSHI